jgi:hypothetical protein
MRQPRVSRKERKEVVEMPERVGWTGTGVSLPAERSKSDVLQFKTLRPEDQSPNRQAGPIANESPLFRNLAIDE